jgi:2-dehydropantoate 2-reductase
MLRRYRTPRPTVLDPARCAIYLGGTLANPEFAILGAGAMGSILAAHLARAGCSVTVLARGKRAAQIENEGICLTGLSQFTQPVRVVRDPADLRGEVLIVAIKGPDVGAILKLIPPEPISAALSIQNGLEKNDLLSDAFGSRRVLGALANTSGEMFADGKVAFTRNAGIYIGELDGASSDRALQIVATIDGSGVRAQASNQILSLEWSKFAAWAGMMVLSVTTRAPTWKYLKDPSAAKLIAQLAAEMSHIARALGIKLTDDSVLPVAAMCAGTKTEAANLVMRLGAQFEQSAPQHRMSALQDLNAGRSLEIEPTLGYAHRLALKLGVSDPTLEACLSLIRAIDQTQR